MTDFLSFYTLPSTIMNHPVHRSLKAAYSFYNVHTTTPLLDLMSDALILAKSVRAPPQTSPVCVSYEPWPLRVVIKCFVSVLSLYAERVRCLQCTGSNGKQDFLGEAQVRHRRRESTVLPVQLEVSQHGLRKGTFTRMSLSHNAGGKTHQAASLFALRK